MVTLEELLRLLLDMGGSDLHITAGSRPRIRVDGELVETDHEVLDAEMTQNMIYGILDDNQIVEFEKELELDLSTASQYRRAALRGGLPDDDVRSRAERICGQTVRRTGDDGQWAVDKLDVRVDAR
jgi:hypothetical protein